MFVYSFADHGSEIADHGRLQKIEILKEMIFWGWNGMQAETLH